MTKKSRPGHIFSIFAFILILLAGQSSGYSYVWCFGSNGHTVVEQAHDFSGAEDKARHEVLASPPGTSEISDHHCGPCLDLVPNNSYASQRLRDNLPLSGAAHFAPPAIESFLRLASLPLQPQSIIAHVAPRIRDQIIHHRTIVMLN